MSVLISRESRFLIQGIAGRFGKFSARDMQAYGTRVVAGVAAGRKSEPVEGVPVFADVRSAVQATGADCSIVYVPATSALDHVIEAFAAGIRFVVYPGDELPVRDAIRMRAAARAAGATLVGPNSPGVITPGQAKAGFMPSFCYAPGPVGVVSRSGSLSYEACHRLTSAGLGQTTVIGIGGDPVKGLTAAEAIELLHADPDTRTIVYLGEIGGRDEYAVAEYARRPGAKPVAALIVGSSAPPGKKMGHAAAMIGGAADTHEAKLAALLAAGVHATGRLSEIVDCARTAHGRAA